MAKVPSTSVPSMAPRPMKMLHGTYPPSPSLPQASIKPSKASRREYGKVPPLSGDTAMTGET